MFHELHFWPMPGALAEAEQIVASNSQAITLDDFRRIYNEVYSRTGLTRSEHKHALEIFNRYSNGKELLKPDAIRAALATVEAHFILTKTEPAILPACLLDALVNEVVKQVMDRRLCVDFDIWSYVLDIT